MLKLFKTQQTRYPFTWMCTCVWKELSNGTYGKGKMCCTVFRNLVVKQTKIILSFDQAVTVLPCV